MGCGCEQVIRSGDPAQFIYPVLPLDPTKKKEQFDSQAPN